jgi:tetratricopeptide (TPR) repeat protein
MLLLMLAPATSANAPAITETISVVARTLTPTEDLLDIERRTVQGAEYRFHAGELRPARTLLEAVLSQGSADRVRADALRLLGEIRYHEDSFP